ncbi:alkyl hydroperoxide reductase [Tanticharoenia sakaeratensis NBRC 103193]|nr:alkyl hydroperoxide reductase [Tanticharoenia sakaeratensis NBRC 103193]
MILLRRISVRMGLFVTTACVLYDCRLTEDVREAVLMTIGIQVGDPAPWLVLPCSDPSGPYHFDKAGGRFVAVLLTHDAASAAPAIARIARHPGLADAVSRLIFTLTPDGAGAGLAPDPAQPGLFHLFDADRRAAHAYGYDGHGAYWVVLDPTLHVVAVLGGSDVETDMVLDLLARVPAFGDRPEAPTIPAIIMSDVFEPAFCDALITEYHTRGFQHSGVFTETVGGQTARAMDSGFKRRRDCILEDETLLDGARARILRRIVPEIGRVFQSRAGYLERVIVASYDGRERGRFGAHRDNTMLATEHRQFAISINLNDQFAGGELVFPEYGPKRFRPPAGGAAVFSCGLLHRVEPVEQGARFACLTFAYDETAAALRRRNWDRIQSEKRPA